MKQISLILLTFAFLLPFPSLAHSEVLTIKTLNSNGTDLSSFTIPTANLAGGASIVAADLGDDGVAEIIVGNGLGNEPRVHVLRQDGSEIGSFLAYAPDMGVGVNVVACDLDGDDINEIITAPMKGGGPQIRAFDNIGQALGTGTFAYAENFRGGVNLTCGNLDDDSAEELITLPAAGGGPHVRVWKFFENNFHLEDEFFSAEQNDTRGLVGTVSDKKIIIASSKGNPISVQTFLPFSHEVIHSQEWTDEGTTLGAAEIFSIDEKLFLVTEGSQHLVNLSDESHLTTTLQTFSPRVAVADDKFFVIDGKILYGEKTEEKNIIIDLSDQRLYAYENGVLANTFLVSTAKLPWTTPIGEHSVLAKLPWVDYTWNYGEGNPNNYNLGLVPWNLRVYPHVYIHYAYWHNNFGHPMSHGCINVNLTNMKWIYDWSAVGTPVEVRE